MAAHVVTFYSYKGGVGRSFAVANIAVILAEWGARVLAVDWDIEAPGLNHYFPGASCARGVLDFLDDCRRDHVRGYASYKSTYKFSTRGVALDLMPASGAQGIDYQKFVQSLDWDELYGRHALGSHLETLREQWTHAYDIVLVDSRTGVTDFSGLTTAQLPDILAVMFTANGQSLGGCIDVAERAMDARRRLPVDRAALLPLPVPARFDQREEYERAQQWRARFVKELAPLFDTWKPRGADPIKLLDLLTIPYQARWTFGEDLAALAEPAGTSGTRSTSHPVTYALETLAALLVHRLAKADLLVSSRDEYVHAARSAVRSWQKSGRAAPQIFISYAQGDHEMAEQVVATLRTAHFAPWIDTEMVQVGDDYAQAVSDAIEDSDGYVILMADASRGQQREIEAILRQKLRSEQQKPIVPVVAVGREKALATSLLSDFAAVPVSDDLPLESTLRGMLSRLANLQSAPGVFTPPDLPEPSSERGSPGRRRTKR